MAQNPTVDVSVSIPPPAANGVSEPAGQPGHLQTSAAPVNNHVAEEGPELSHVAPRRGPVSGGEEIVLIVSNLPSTIKLYARFGCRITLTVSEMMLPGFEEYIRCAEVSRLDSSCTRGTFLCSPRRSRSWAGQGHTMSSTIYRCRILWEIFSFLRVRG